MSRADADAAAAAAARFAPAFDAARVSHVAARRRRGDAALRILRPQDFAAARAEISAWPGHAPTPLLELPALAADLRLGRLLYKDEGPRFGLGSFKALGGAYAALRLLQRQASPAPGREASAREIRSGALAERVAAITLVSATDGNHGRSLAWGCRRFGARCRIFIHAGVSEARAEAMRALGARVTRIAGDYDASVEAARREAEANGWFVVSDTSWPGCSAPPRDVMAGYGVMTGEIVAAMDAPPSHVFVQGGVGGLAASVAAALRQSWGDRAPRMVVVEPETAACLFESARRGRPASVPIARETCMAGLSCGEPSPMAWEILAEEASDFLAISDDLVAPTVRLLARPRGADPAIAAGESGAAGLAALIAAARRPALRAALGLDAASSVLLIGSEGVTDSAIYEAMLAGASDA